MLIIIHYIIQMYYCLQLMIIKKHDRYVYPYFLFPTKLYYLLFSFAIHLGKYIVCVLRKRW